ncbi:insulin receptor substrate 1 isoform X2 [Spodoptera frugiperda]|uniref:Insulin receptor substrate 1 n=1 Tax=Spodoptera frugiperda TaxID=7108 RepID=A0A9R0DM47_SPOFR|nr:insulin receptor substrate 1 isoform X2 [Spodoptera frugiperda]
MSAVGGGGAGAVVRQGQLRKLKTMKKKYFVLRAETPECSARLEYYESEKKFRAGVAPRRVLPLKSCYNIMRRLDLKQKHVIALFTREEQFCVVADNEQDLHAWLTAILKQHRSDDASDELLHPIQHVWQVNVQKKGLGATKNIQGLYNLCLTDKTLTLVKIKSHNNVISDLGLLERVEYSLKNIRRCGDSERFFYMEVGRQTTTGAGELWMHTDDSNIAQSMHSTIYHAMRDCAKETENERDHIVLPKGPGDNALPARRQSYSDGRGRAGLTNADSQNNTLTDKTDNPVRIIKHHRTESLPTGYPLFQEPLKISHGRTRSEPLTGEEVDRVLVEKGVTHSSCKAINGTDTLPKKTQWSRRASTGTRLHKLSPAHTKNAETLRNRCVSMPSRACSSFEVDRPSSRYPEVDGLEVSRDETDAVTDWYRTPRIPEEPDCCDISRDPMSLSLAGAGSVAHSRTSSVGEAGAGYLPMAPGHEPLAGLISASSGSLCSGTPSTDPRFSEYQLEPATSHIGLERPPRAYSVGSRPAGAPAPEARHRAYSVGARARPPRHPVRPNTDDHMEIDFSNNSPANRVISRTPPTACFVEPRPKTNVDEYVDMSPRNAGYVEMRPGEPRARTPPAVAPVTPAAPATPDGYVEMHYGRAATRPIAIGAARPPPPLAASPDERRRREPRTPHGSQTLFDMSLDSPASPQDADPDLLDEDPPHHPLTTVREISEDGRRSPDIVPCAGAPRRSPEVSVSPQYVTLALTAAPPKTPEPCGDELSCNPTANKTIARVPDPIETRVCTAEGGGAATLVVAGGGAAARFVGAARPLNYAALDLEPRRALQPAAPRHYTQIDFLRSEKLHVADT